jgi:hypothetical protein
MSRIISQRRRVKGYSRPATNQPGGPTLSLPLRFLSKFRVTQLPQNVIWPFLRPPVAAKVEMLTCPFLRRPEPHSPHGWLKIPFNTVFTHLLEQLLPSPAAMPRQKPRGPILRKRARSRSKGRPAGPHYVEAELVPSMCGLSRVCT